MKTKRAPASFVLIHQVRFNFRYMTVLCAIEQEKQRDYLEDRIIPNRHWRIEETYDHSECAVIFSSDEPFDPAELEQCRANIELLDAACEVMVTGTKAEHT